MIREGFRLSSPPTRTKTCINLNRLFLLNTIIFTIKDTVFTFDSL